MARPSTNLRELQQWLHRSVAEAEVLLPGLLDLSPAVLLQHLGSRPELRTAGMMQRLLDVAHGALAIHPRRAYELTSVAVGTVRSLQVPAGMEVIALRLQGQAWVEHANALRGLGQPGEARDAARCARALFENTPASEWYLAMVDLAESQILHDLGEREPALRLVRRAGSLLALHGDHAGYLQARTIEAWMLWVGGDYAGAADVWKESAEAARYTPDRTLFGRLLSYVGYFELHHGDAGRAWELLSDARDVLDAEGLKEEAIRARENMAEAALRRGRLHESISEWHKVRTEFLGAGAVIDAAVAAVETLELLLVAGREDELAPLTSMYVASFREAGMTQNALLPFTWLCARAERGALSQEDLGIARRYFEDLPQQPNAPFRPPER